MITNECGIYKITNTSTNDFYIGSTINLRRRLSRHQKDLTNGRHENMHLQNSWNKYGEEAFEFSIIEFCEKEMLLIREQFYFDLLKPVYNKAPIAGNCLGVKHSDESKRRMSEGHMGLHLPPLTEEHKRKISEANTGKIFSEEHKRKLGESARGNTRALGHKCTEEAKRKIGDRIVSNQTRQKMSEAHMRELNYNFGKHFSDEHKCKIGEANIGRVFSEETKRNMSLSHLGQIVSEETKSKISEANKGKLNHMFGKHHTEETKLILAKVHMGKHHSEETKLKLSEIASRYWKEKRLVN